MELNLSKNWIGIFIAVYSLLPSCINADVECNQYLYCYGDNAYCCPNDQSYMQKCCYDTFVYHMWWFWLIWVFVLLILFGCGLFCWQRRRMQIRYTVMANSQYPSYGTVIHPSSTPAYSTPAGAVPPYGSNYSQAPPPDYYSQPQKPPPYPTA